MFTWLMISYALTSLCIYLGDRQFIRDHLDEWVVVILGTPWAILFALVIIFLFTGVWL